MEQFNYAQHNTLAGGLNLALHHHSDKPMMQFSSQLISAGLETHINLKPILSYTTKNALSMLSPIERKCYTNSEANLTYLPFSSGYRLGFLNLPQEPLFKFAFKSLTTKNMNKQDLKKIHNNSF